MLQLLPGLIFTSILVTIVYLLWRQRIAFVIKVRNGEARLVAGTPDPQFIEDIERICALWGIEHGTVRGIKSKRRVRIYCRGPLKAQRQALQNAIDHTI